MAKKLRILFVTSEVTPLAKTGGMADVCDALPKFLAKAGHEVDVIMPCYRSVKNLGIPTETVLDSFAVQMGDQEMTGRLLTAKIDRPWRPLLVEQEELYDRDGLYTDPVSGQDYPDNARRFGFFAKAVLAALKNAKKPYHLVHAHEWQGALVVVYLKKFAGDDPRLNAPATVFTVHNMGYMGLFTPEQGAIFDLPPAAFVPEDMEFFGKWNLLKGGLNHADFLTTVSEKYAKEIQTEEFGFGLQGILQSRADRLAGITHGVDYAFWNPATDPYLVAPYGPGKLAGKQKCKEDLLAVFGIGKEWVKKPIAGFIGRLVEQKGLDLIMPIIEDLLAHGYILIFLGAGEKKYEAALRDLQARFADRVGVHIGFSEELAHKVEAGADLLLVPSLYEPCGLSQMYSQKYGTLPVVRATGGLDDTVSGWAKGKRNANGFKFTEKDPEALLRTLADAALLYDDKKRWKKLVDAAMELDHSWESVAKKYERLYAKALKAKNEPAAAPVAE